jgi:hypothetical protein
MSDIRKKVSMLQVMVDIKPYIINMIAMMTKRFVENVLKKDRKIERTFIDLGMIKLMSIWTAMAELPCRMW